MENVVGVCFRPTGKVYYFSAAALDLQPGDAVIAETTKGQELAEVVCRGLFGANPREATELKPIVRRATAEDVERAQENRRRASEARRVCQRLVTQLELPVKLVDVEFAFDGSRVTFAFACEDRLDFRALQRELREIYDCEIEVRQIGVRDQAKILGGLGPCGRHLCCASFLRHFQPVTIKMAKDQDLSLNPTKISGLCGRLMCCLRYEHNVYRACREGLPEVGSIVETAQGRGEVVGLDVLRRQITLDLGETTVQVTPEEIEKVVVSKAAKRRAEAPPANAAAPAPPPAPPARLEAPLESAPPVAAAEAIEGEESAPKAKRRRRRGRRSRRGRSSGGEAGAAPGPPPSSPPTGQV